MFLEEIIRYKRHEIKVRQEAIPFKNLESRLTSALPVRPFVQSLSGDAIRLIAEVKKASPSKGLLCPDLDPESFAQCYEQSGAAAVSVLTDERFFQGNINYLHLIKQVTQKTPVLRKDFIIDPYQLMEARVAGADAVLLIVAALTEAQLADFIHQSLALNLTPLVEVHTRFELETAIEAGAEVIGINNRNLHSFKVDLDTTFELIQWIPEDLIVVSESGIQNRRHILELEEAGVDAVLIGESLVMAEDPRAKIQELLGAAS